jgi:formate dehydrogenase/NADH-quinone oxidoreductase subunit F
MNLISELLAVQRAEGHLGRQTLARVSRDLGVPLYRLQELVSFYPHLRTTPPAEVTVTVCRDVSCMLGGGEGLAERLRSVLGDDARFEVQEVSCLGHCDLAPAVMVDGVPVRLDDLDAFVADLLGPGPEAREVRSARWPCDPYDDPSGRYGAIRKMIGAWKQRSTRDAILDALMDAGLRGMGGAGFPTGRKWEMVRAAEGRTKYVICNADESEPGTFKDRRILEDLPHLVIEGLVLDAFTVGAKRGYIYLRHEYEEARKALERELERARQAGVLGVNILGSGVDIDLEVFVSPGGYILGEETALLEALEGKRGEPRNKPPYPGQSGLHGCPTLINNVETLALAPAIVMRGARWWKEQGTGEYAGLKFMAVSGHVQRPGVYQVPFGTTVGELIEEAGGVKDGRPLKAFAPGGASSPLLPASRADTPIDFGAMAGAGSMLGSGALVVIAEPTPMLPLVANLVRFFRDESCGKCVPCRVGTEKALRIVEAARDEGVHVDAGTVERLDEVMREASICGLGHVALVPLTSVMRHFPDEVP